MHCIKQQGKHFCFPCCLFRKSCFSSWLTVVNTNASTLVRFALRIKKTMKNKKGCLRVDTKDCTPWFLHGKGDPAL